MIINTTFLCLGTNHGNREEHLNKAVEMISDSVGEIISFSHIYETEPWGFRSDSKFLNMVIKIKTKLKPELLLKEILTIEAQMGRTRNTERYIPRTIDIDILLYDDLILNKPDLKIPHPKIGERQFVLVPLCEIAPDLVHPVLKKTFAALRKECRDEGEVNRIN